MDVVASDPHVFFERFVALLKAVRAASAHAYAKVDVGSAQAKLLRHIGRNSRISQADLARATDTAPTLTGRAVEPLVERGWIRRKRSEEDRREYILELTAAGERMRGKVDGAREALIQRLAAVLDERDVADFERIAKKILAELEGPPVG